MSVFTAHLSNDLNLARIRLICLFITALCKVKSVNYSKLSSRFDSPSAASSCFRRIQRFMAQADLPMRLISTLIFNILQNDSPVVLVMDRTNWKFGQQNINIRMLGISYKSAAIPIMFKMLDKRGNSNSQERITLVQNFIDWFGQDCIDCILADREFIGEKWLGFLNEHSIRNPIRIRNNFKVFLPRKQKEITVWHLFNNLKSKEFRHYQHIVEMHGQLCYLSATKTVIDGKIEFLILVSFNKSQQALEYYRRGWNIETLFRFMKSSVDLI
ncbi:IS4 family transposase [Sphingobacterium sp. JB170]|uniref:IS4 family transposase n=1 Tax=Sphingobacterium sp. JB170 TaxID=1434842 RepID=UPI00097F3EEA|nr:IS4 family transposase [Sphingobacterium sp. JB170]SJN19108.1 hypothetical protein FM107_01640 [Sphingobacterium sp. JB170]